MDTAVPAARRRRPPQDRPRRRARRHRLRHRRTRLLLRHHRHPGKSRTSSRPWSATSSPEAAPPGSSSIAATQRPRADIIPTSLRDLFGFRVAFRCTTDSSSDIILSVGWAKEGYSARTIRPEDIGVGFILAEGGIPRRFKAAYLTDSQIRAVIATALRRRGHNPAA